MGAVNQKPLWLAPLSGRVIYRCSYALSKWSRYYSDVKILPGEVVDHGEYD
jgi:hypothetical protein